MDTVTSQDLRDILFANGPEAALRYDQLGGSEDSKGVAHEDATMGAHNQSYTKIAHLGSNVSEAIVNHHQKQP